MPPDSALTILSLPHELIVEVLKNCPVETILSLEQTCKSLHQICHSRSVWDACIRRLDVTHAPAVDPFEPLQAIPTASLRRKVINAIRQHNKWRDPEQHHHMHVVNLPLNRQPGDLDVLVEPRLLPGGREVVILNCGRIELWSLVTKERIWELRSPIGRFSCAGFDLDVVDGGNIINIAVLFENFETTATSPLRIYAIDLRSKESKVLLECTLPPVFLFRMMLRGDYFIACVPRSNRTIVMDWKKGESLLLNFVDSEGTRLDPRCTILADTELISFLNLKETGFSAVRLPLSALEGRWSRAVDHSLWTQVSICPFQDGTVVLPLPYPDQQQSVVNGNDGFGPYILAHRVFRPTWTGKGQDAPIEIFLAAYVCGPNGQTPSQLVSFRLQLFRSRHNLNEAGPELELITSSCAQARQLPWNSRSLSNSGTMFALRSKIKCFCLFADTTQPTNEIPLGRDIVPCADEMEPVISCVEPWSGAIAIGMPGMVKVINFD